MIYCFLSDKFRIDYPERSYPEIERKSDRPYIMLLLTIDEHIFAVPMRSHIRHKYSYLTDIQAGSGIDFTKTIYISDDEYLDIESVPYVRQKEFDFLRGKERIIKEKLIKYIKGYVESKDSADENKKRAYQYTTLRYFENIVDYEKDILEPLGIAEDGKKTPANV